MRTLSFDQRAITCECANEGMFKNVFAGMTCVCVCVCMISGTADRRVLTPSVRSRAGENGSDIISLELSAPPDPNS